jgi:hypothetical protein
MSDDTVPGFPLLARLQRQLLMEIGSIRDDLAVLTAIAMRQDETPAALFTEARGSPKRGAHRSAGDALAAWQPYQSRARD